jgi:hypothetical protein
MTTQDVGTIVFVYGLVIIDALLYTLAVATVKMAIRSRNDHTTEMAKFKGAKESCERLTREVSA